MIAVTLTVVGLYGLLSYIASAQTRDLGVRLALGAPRTSVLLLMLKRGVEPALIGVTIGVIAEAASPNIFSGALFYGVGMHDIPTLVSVALRYVLRCCRRLMDSIVARIPAQPNRGTTSGVIPGRMGSFFNLLSCPIPPCFQRLSLFF